MSGYLVPLKIYLAFNVITFFHLATANIKAEANYIWKTSWLFDLIRSSWLPGGRGDHGGVDVHGDGGGGAAVRPHLRQDPGDLQTAKASSGH